MSELDEYKLISAIKEGDFTQIADQALIVLEARKNALEALTVQHTTLMDKLERLTEAINKFEDGFPEGDIHGHRIYHERLMRSVIAQEDFWNNLKSDLAKKGLWAILIILVGLLITGISTKLGIPQ